MTSSSNEPHVSGSELEALVTDRIADAVQAALNQIGRSEFEKLTGLDDNFLSSILNSRDQYLSVSIVTVACQINKSHNDPNLLHSSLTECLKGTTIRIPPIGALPSPGNLSPQSPRRRRRLVKSKSSSVATGPLLDRSSARLLGFGANLISFLILGYFFGGVALSPLIGQTPCIGVSSSPLSLAPCEGSFIGLVVSAIGGLGYTYYYFVKKL